MLGAPSLVLLALLAVWSGQVHSTHIDSIKASVDRKPHHTNYIPMVAFKCGYRNQFINEAGEWQSDASSVATCLQGKLDILKYCKRMYPGKKITNIVEYNHISQIRKWCDEKTGRDCDKTYYIRPYRCLEGEFTADSLQVPSKCRFGHVSGRDTCEDFRQWREKGEKQCAASIDSDSKAPMKLHSFGLLEPCGLSLFRGVEYVCCPKDVQELFEDGHLDAFKDKLADFDDEEDEDDEDDDEDEEESSSESSDKETDGQDPYFTEDSEANEHDRYKDAIERLEKKHRGKVTKVINEWSSLFERYNKMKEHDPKGAETFKEEMTNKFRKTVASLEQENKDQRRQMEEVHDERVQNGLNEKKRKATHDYRTALAIQVGQLNKKEVLKTLKDYIRAEEKDRSHMLNRYKHLLRSNSDAAASFEPMLLHRLRYIDLRINGTLAMLRDFPTLEKQIKPIAQEFWWEYRKENTPDINEEDLKATNGAQDANEKLIKLYKNAFDRSSQHKKSATAIVIDKVMADNTDHKHKTEFISLDEILSDKRNDKKEKIEEPVKIQKIKAAEFDSDEDQFEEDDDEDELRKIKEKLEDEKKKEVKIQIIKDDEVETIYKEPILKKAEVAKKLEDSDEDDDVSDEDDDEDDDVSEEDAHVIVNNEDLYVRKEVGPSFAKHDNLVEYYSSQSFEESASYSTPTTIIVLATVVLCAVGIVGVILRHRPSRQGFVEVDVCSPDDQHVDKMQINGYENPTYNFYDQKP